MEAWLKEAKDKLVKDIAEDGPITSWDETNYCRFCNITWAEDTFDEYLENEISLAVDPGARTRTGSRIAWEHHEKDCVWVRANTILKGEHAKA